MEESRTNVKEEIRWNGQEEASSRRPERKKREDEDVGGLLRRCEQDGAATRTRRVVFFGFVACLSNLTNRQQHTPFCSRNTTATLSIDLDALTAGQSP